MERYQRVRILGRGSFATVILAKLEEKQGASLCVVKEVDLARADDKRRTDALHEAELLKSLSHPNIIAYHEAHLANARLCIVMEYADAGDLSTAIASRRSAGRRHHEREAMAIFVQLAMALHYIHDRRILHRDLKCQNVFLTHAAVVKLGDFGIAKVLEAADSMAETRIGTPYYLPPEMCSNKPYDFRADIWCLGVVLYEVLALEVPFTASSISALVMKICHTEPRAVSQSYSSDLRGLLVNMMAKRPEDRPSSAEIVALPHVRRGIALLLKPEAARSIDAVDVAMVPTASSLAVVAHVADVGIGIPAGGERAFESLTGADLEISFSNSDEQPAEQQPLQVRNSASSLKQALESSMACEQLLQELEQEFNLT